MSEVADMCTMGGSDIQAGIPFSKIHDVSSQCDFPTSSVGQSPKMVHGMGSPGSKKGLNAGGLGTSI